MEQIDSMLFVIAVTLSGTMALIILCACFYKFYKWMRSFDSIDRMHMIEAAQNGPWYEQLDRLDDEKYQKFLTQVDNKRRAARGY